jgi:hypothetical protein
MRGDLTRARIFVDGRRNSSPSQLNFMERHRRLDIRLAEYVLIARPGGAGGFRLALDAIPCETPLATL